MQNPRNDCRTVGLKFLDAKAADYKKEVAAKVPNYYRLLEKAGDKVLDFSHVWPNRGDRL